MKNLLTTGLKPMPLDDIKKKIQNFRTGSAHWVCWLSEQESIITSHGVETYYLVKKALVRFKVPYNKIMPIRFEQTILKAETKEQMDICSQIWDLMSNDQKDAVAPAMVRMFKQKIEDLKKGLTIEQHEKREVKKTVDAEFSFISYPSTKNTLVTVEKSFLKNIKTGKLHEPEFLYFWKDSTGGLQRVEESQAIKDGVVFKKNPIPPSASWTLSASKIIYIE